MYGVPKFTIALASAVIFAVLACQDMKFIATENPVRDSSQGKDKTTDTDLDIDSESGSPTNTDSDSDSAVDTVADTDSDSGADTGTDTDTDTHGDTDTGPGCGVPTYFRWTSSPPLITPPGGTIAIKDPTVVYHDGRWHIYATTRSDDWSMTYLSFADWNDASDAPKTSVSKNPNLADYKAAPQIFYFSSQRLWYLVYQTPNPAYSTTTDPGDVGSWSEMNEFMSVAKGIDYWVICDDDNCYMFYSADDGGLYRAKTAKTDFPRGFKDSTETVMKDDQFKLYDACNVYKMAGTGKYLLLVSAIGDIGRYFRAFTSSRLDGAWTELADTEDQNFASVNNVTGADWATDGINHGEMLRDNPDETMTIDTCDMQYLFQGLTSEGPSHDDYNDNEYSLGLLTDAR
jgi:hypothetical protein